MVFQEVLMELRIKDLLRTANAGDLKPGNGLQNVLMKWTKSLWQGHQREDWLKAFWHLIQFR